MTRIAIRGFVRGVKQFEEQMDGERPDLNEVAERHAMTLLALPGGDRHMIEIEFMDEPNPLTRYFRFGTDPEFMVLPIEIRGDD